MNRYSRPPIFAVGGQAPQLPLLVVPAPLGGRGRHWWPSDLRVMACANVGAKPAPLLRRPQKGLITERLLSA
jgi:hypothetical protein